MMTSISKLVFIVLLLFQIPCCFVMDSRPSVSVGFDPGAQSGHETQFLFSEGDVRRSDADDIHVSARGKFIIP